MPWWQRRSPAREAAGRWPVVLPAVTPSGVHFVLRPAQGSDEHEFAAVRRANRSWLSPWDATSPTIGGGPHSFAELVATYEAEARAGRSLPFIIEREGHLVGQLTVSNIVYGSFRSCTVGYWIARTSAGLGITPSALARAGDYAFATLGLHRIEINIRPENQPSLAVVRKLGFREEGLRPHMLHIDGQWRDHVSFALTTEDLAGETLHDRLNQSSQQSLWRHTDPPAGA